MRKTIIVLLGVVLLLSAASVTASGTMNRIELNSASLVNDERRDAGLRTMTRQACLQKHAEVHAKRMADSNRLYHRTGSALRTVMKRCKLTSIGENIARGTAMTSPTVVRSWMGSSGHRANILNSSFNRIGAAYSNGDNRQRYWIQLYGRH